MKRLEEKVSKLKIPLEDLSYFVSNYKFDNLKIFLTILFAILYLPHIFILNEDIGIMLAFEADPGSITKTTIGLLENYNFHDHYHSRTYGWTYYFINFVLLFPVKLFLDFFNFTNSDRTLLYFVKLVFFVIGFLSMLAFHEVLLKIFKNKFYILIGSMFYIAGDLGFIFYFIHPETTGLLFMFLAILMLLNLIEKPDQYKYYIYGLIFLALSTLSKQIFFFTSVFILPVFIATIFFNERCRFIDFLASRKFLNLTIHSFLVAFVTLLIINPFLIFDFENGINYQIQLFKIHNEGHSLAGVLSTNNLVKLWIYLLGSTTLALFYFILMPFAYVVTIFTINRNSKKEQILFLYMLTFIYVILFVIFLGNRLYVISLYLAPIYPFLIIYMLSLISYFSDSRLKLRKIVPLCLLLLFCIISLIRSIDILVSDNFSRLYSHKSSIAYKTHDFILKNIDRNDKVIFDQFVGFPSSMKKNGCSYLFNEHCLKKFKPDYIMVNKDFLVNGKINDRLREILTYIKKENMVIDQEIEADNLKISVYKVNKDR